MTDFSLTSRRQFLNSGLGFGALALHTMLARDAAAGSATLARGPAKAKSVIWLFMRGGVSHMESFDPKPALNRYAGALKLKLAGSNIL